jgi:hypothetical protein
MDRNRSFVSERAKTASESEFVLKHTINTNCVDRYGTIVVPKGADVKQFLRNPVVLWLHNSDGGKVKVPIGKCIKLEVEDKKIVATTKFNRNDEFAVKVYNAFRDGFLNAWSIGFIPKSYLKYTLENREELNSKYKVNVKVGQVKEAGIQGIYLVDKWELLEYSAVPVPGNPETLNSGESKLEFEKQLAVRGLILEMEKPKEEKKELQKVDEEVREEKKEAVEDLDKTDPIKAEEEEAVSLESLVDEADAPTELEKEQQEEDSGETEDEGDITEITLNVPVEEKAQEEAPKEEKAPKEEAKAEPEEKEEAKEEVTEEAEDTAKVELEAKITALEATVSELRGLVEELTKGTSDSLKKVTDSVESIQKSLEVDNIEKLRELENQPEPASQVEAFDWADLLSRAKSSK